MPSLSYIRAKNRLDRAYYGSIDPQDEVPSPDTNDLAAKYPDVPAEDRRAHWYEEQCEALAEAELENLMDCD